jgi:hypothetical protein
MIRKISFLLLSIGIVVVGYIAFRELSYWERSVRIFKYEPDTAFQGRGGRGHEGRSNFRGVNGSERPGGRERGFERPGIRELPDSIRQRLEARREGVRERGRNIPDSLRRDFAESRLERASFMREGRGGDRHGRGGLPDGRKMNLRNVYWFLAVFSLFTVAVIYLDKAICLLKKKKQVNK